MDVADLKSCLGEELITFIPHLTGEFGHGGGEAVYGIVGQVRIGDMALLTVDGEHTAE